MGVMQPLKGSSNKFYNVIASFDKGIDKKTSDDVADDSSFKNLKNFYNETSGELSKRPGVYNSNVKPFIKNILEGNFSEKFKFINNKFEETPEEVLPRLQDFYDTILCGNKKEKHHDGIAETRYFSLDKIVGFQIIRNNKFLEALQEYETLTGEEIAKVLKSEKIEPEKTKADIFVRPTVPEVALENDNIVSIESIREKVGKTKIFKRKKKE